jgi:hypothetical protein
VSAANIAAGNLKFTPAGDANGAGYASFTFQVQDNGGTANGGVDLDQTPNTMTINVTAVDDAPVIAQNTLTLTAGSSVTLSAAQLSATDIDDPAAGLLFNISSISHGQFELAAAPSVAITSFTQAQITAGQVRFVHDASTSAPSYDVSVSDGTLSAGPATASVSFSMGSASTTPASTGPVIPPSVPSAPPVVPPVASPPPASPPEPVPSTSDSGSSSSHSSESSSSDSGTSESGDGGGSAEGGGGGGGGGHSGGGARGLVPGAAAGFRVIGMLDSSAIRPARLDARALSTAPVKLSSAMPEVHSLPPLETGMLIQSSDVQISKFQGSTRADWSVTSAYHDGFSLKQQKEQFSVLLDSAEMGGIAFSVGVVWWASRVTGVIGSMMASMPAWRQLDPLPVVGSDDDGDEVEWQSEDDRTSYADELRVSMVLEGVR